MTDNQESREVSKRDEGSFRVMTSSRDEVRDIIRLNLQGSKISSTDIPRIKVPTGGSTTWQVPTLDGETNAKSVEGIVVCYTDRRAFWPGQEVTGQPPSCRSDDMVRGIGVRKEGDDPGPHECDSCEFAQFGSGARGRGQACKQVRSVYLMQPDIYLPIALNLPPTSLKSTRQWFLRLAQYGVRFDSIVTGFKLEKKTNPDGQAYAIVNPYKVRDLSPEEEKFFRWYGSEIRPYLESSGLQAEDVIDEEEEETYK